METILFVFCFHLLLLKEELIQSLNIALVVESQRESHTKLFLASQFKNQNPCEIILVQTRDINPITLVGFGCGGKVSHVS